MNRREPYFTRLSTAVTVGDLAFEVARCLDELADQRQPEAGRCRLAVLIAGERMACEMPHGHPGCCSFTRKMDADRAQPEAGRGETVGDGAAETTEFRCSSRSSLGQPCERPAGHSGQCGSNQPPSMYGEPITASMDAWGREMVEAGVLNEGHVFFAIGHAKEDQAAAVERATKAMREELAKVERELARVKKEHVPAKPPAGMSVREAARKRYALFGSDAQALEGAISLTERERDANATAANELAELRALAPRIPIALLHEEGARFRALLHLDREGG